MTAPLTLVLVTSSPAVTTRLVHGAVLASALHPKGRVVQIPAGEIVFYSLEARRVGTFVFRTLGAPEALSSAVPGVSPRVRLLLQAQTRGRLRRLEQLLEYLARVGRRPSSLSDGFYSRLHALLSGRLPKAKVLQSLLGLEDASTGN